MEIEIIQKRILEIRGCRVMLDFHLAGLYGVETKVLNQAVKRNIDRFPADFMFQLSENEYDSMWSQFVTTYKRRKTHLPMAFTEHGITMLSSVLRSPVAIQVNIAVVRAFILLKQYNNDIAVLKEHIQALEIHFNKKIDSINQLIELLLEQKKTPPEAEREMIGYKVKKEQ